MNFTVENNVGYLYLRVSDTDTAYYKEFSTNDYAVAEFDIDDNLVGIKIFDAIQYILSEMKYTYSIKDISYYLKDKKYPVANSVNDA